MYPKAGSNGKGSGKDHLPGCIQRFDGLVHAHSQYPEAGMNVKMHDPGKHRRKARRALSNTLKG